jgi:hypothetical protein
MTIVGGAGGAGEDVSNATLATPEIHAMAVVTVPATVGRVRNSQGPVMEDQEAPTGQEAVMEDQEPGMEGRFRARLAAISAAPLNTSSTSA